MICVGYIGLLFIVGAAFPKLFEVFDLTTLEREAPVKMAAGEEVVDDEEKPAEYTSGDPGEPQVAVDNDELFDEQSA